MGELIIALPDKPIEVTPDSNGRLLTDLEVTVQGWEGKPRCGIPDRSGIGALLTPDFPPEVPSPFPGLHDIY